MLETQTMDMNKYREMKDKLEYESMMRNPETAYLVSNEEFDKQIDELGWSAKDIATMAACTSKEACTISERMCGILCGRYWSYCLLPLPCLSTRSGRSS